MSTSSVDRDYWMGPHPHPLAPNEADVSQYSLAIGDSSSTLLLGNTPALIRLCTVALDLEPFDTTGVSRQGDWTANTEYFDAIIGDGALNFTPELTTAVLEMALNHSAVFVARVFRRRLPIMRIADHFPAHDEFRVAPTEVIDRTDYSFYIWRTP
ncbi:MAG: hypothetical protein ACOYBP_00155 [Microbacteriaceae bacterium]